MMARAVREMSKLGEAVGGKRDTFSGLAGMGDLIVTCTSKRSRNRFVGEELGSGKPIADIIASMSQVAEGVKSASVIMEFAEKYGLNMPIAREVDAVVNHGATVEDAYQGLMAEKPGKEIESGRFSWKLDLEDVHLNIEARLTQLVGDAGKRLHTGRSRND